MCPTTWRVEGRKFSAYKVSGFVSWLAYALPVEVGVPDPCARISSLAGLGGPDCYNTNFPQAKLLPEQNPCAQFPGNFSVASSRRKFEDSAGRTKKANRQNAASAGQGAVHIRRIPPTLLLFLIRREVAGEGKRCQGTEV